MHAYLQVTVATLAILQMEQEASLVPHRDIELCTPAAQATCSLGIQSELVCLPAENGQAQCQIAPVRMLLHQVLFIQGCGY